jgi:hypothetical protein
MIFPRLNRTEPEKVWMCVKAGEALLAGFPVCLQFTGTDDGKIGMQPDAAVDGTRVIGVADKAIASGEYGLVQCYGFRSDAQVTGGSAFAANCGAALGVGSESSGFFSMVASVGAITTVQPNFVYAHSVSKASTSAVYTVGIFIRCM